MTKVKVFVHAANAKTRAMTIAPRNCPGLLKSEITIFFQENVISVSNLSTCVLNSYQKVSGFTLHIYDISLNHDTSIAHNIKAIKICEIKLIKNLEI